MIRALQIAVIIFLAAGAAAFAAIAYRVITAPVIPDLAPVVAHADRTLSGLDKIEAQIDAPCTGYHGSVSCGVLAQAAQTEKNIGIVAGQTALQVKQSGELVAAATQSLQETSAAARVDLDTLNAQETRVGPLLDSLRVSSDSIPPAMTSLAVTEQQATADLKSMDALLTDKSITETAANVQHMTATADAVETKATKGYLHPSHNPFRRIWNAVSPFLVAGAKITAALF